MDLNEQAFQAVSAVLAEAGVTTTDELTLSMMKRAWFDGYTAGMNAVNGIAQASFERLQAELS